MAIINVSVPSVNSNMATYGVIQVGYAPTQEVAAAQTGTGWVNAGALATLATNVTLYEITVPAGAANQWYVWRLFNTTNSAASSWSTPVVGKSSGYLTVEEFKELGIGDLTNPDGTDIDPARLRSFLKSASSIADKVVGYKFEFRQTTEKHPWDQKSRRIYPRERNIIGVSAVKIQVSAQQSADFTVQDIYLNSDRGYIEITSLANVTYSLFPAIVALGMVQPQAMITYTHGYETIPEDVKLAVAHIAADILFKDNIIKKGMGGLSNFAIGGMSMAFSQGSKSSTMGDHEIPQIAKTLLREYVMINVR
jgi:hypothetical protein